MTDPLRLAIAIVRAQGAEPTHLACRSVEDFLAFRAPVVLTGDHATIAGVVVATDRQVPAGRVVIFEPRRDWE